MDGWGSVGSGASSARDGRHRGPKKNPGRLIQFRNQIEGVSNYRVNRFS